MKEKGLLIIFIITMFACKDGDISIVNRSDSFKAKVEIPVGASFIETIGDKEYSYLPYPFSMIEFRNSGLKNIEAVFIGTNVKKRTRVDVIPVALLEMKEFGKLKRYVIVVPNDEKYVAVKLESYVDLVTKHYEIKNNIENWFLNRYGLGNISSLKWFDTDKSMLFVQRYWKE